MTVWTIGHGTRPAEELVETLCEVGVCTVIDVRRFPGSRHNPQFNQQVLAARLAQEGIAYRHAVELGGRLSGEPGEDRFACLRVAAFRSYAARMGAESWQHALSAALAEPRPCLMCSETLWWRCHRRLIGELLHARGEHVVHLLGPGKQQEHRSMVEAEARNGRLYLWRTRCVGAADRLGEVIHRGRTPRVRGVAVRPTDPGPDEQHVAGYRQGLVRFVLSRVSDRSRHQHRIGRAVAGGAIDPRIP